MAARAPDIIELEIHEQRAPRVSWLLSHQHDSWTLCLAVFLIAAAASFGAALVFSSRHSSNVPVVRREAQPSSLALLPTIQPALQAEVLDDSQLDAKKIDEVSAYDEVRHRRPRKSRGDESAAYNPRNGKASKTAAPSKRTAQPDPTKVSPRTNW